MTLIALIALAEGRAWVTGHHQPLSLPSRSGRHLEEREVDLLVRRGGQPDD